MAPGSDEAVRLNRAPGPAGALRRAAGFDPTFAQAWLSLYNLCALPENWRGLAEALAQVLRLAPALKPEARRAGFLSRVWAAGIAMRLLPTSTP